MKSRELLLLAIVVGIGALIAGASLLGWGVAGPPLEGSPAQGSETETPTDQATPAPPEDPEALAAWFQAEVMREFERSEAREAPVGDPEALAAWFQREVTREVERSKAREGRKSVARASPPPEDTRADRMIASLKESGRFEEVDWSYLQDVFDGRVRGIPNEGRAGLTLQEMDALGDVPYLEGLREEGRFDEVIALGVVQEPAPTTCPLAIAPGPRRDFVCWRWARRAGGPSADRADG